MVKTCRHCGQVNVRYEGWRALFNPRQPKLCTFCNADLETGRRTALDAALAVPMRVAVYGAHALVGGFTLLVVPPLVWPALLDDRPVLWALGALGAGLAVARAERARRRGALLTKRRD
jgi:hypothetical protein